LCEALSSLIRESAKGGLAEATLKGSHYETFPTGVETCFPREKLKVGQTFKFAIKGHRKNKLQLKG